MQKLAATSSLIVYYDDLLYLESSLSAAAEDHPSIAPLVKQAADTKKEISDLQDKEKAFHEEVVKKRARSKYFDASVDSEILQSGMTMEQAVNRDYSHPEYKLFFEKHSASDMIRLGVTRENQEIRKLLQKSEALPESHPFRTKHSKPITLKVEKSEKADQEYKEAQQAEKNFYAGVNLRKVAWNKTRREIYVSLQGLFPHDKGFVESFFPEVKASDVEEETPAQSPNTP